MTQPDPKSDAKRNADANNIVGWLEGYRKDHPLSPSTSLKADKAFYDSLNEDQPGDRQFQFTDLA